VSSDRNLCDPLDVGRLEVTRQRRETPLRHRRNALLDPGAHDPPQQESARMSGSLSRLPGLASATPPQLLNDERPDPCDVIGGWVVAEAARKISKRAPIPVERMRYDATMSHIHDSTAPGSVCVFARRCVAGAITPRVRKNARTARLAPGLDHVSPVGAGECRRNPASMLSSHRARST